MEKFAVLDDCTRNANIIGEAESAEQAADVFMAYMAERIEADDLAWMERPTFCYRTETSVVSPAFEPLW